jgi:hypothetical protein
MKNESSRSVETDIYAGKDEQLAYLKYSVLN